MNLRAVTFDLDGLMFNTEELYDVVMHELCRRRQVIFSDELRVKMMGQPGPKALLAMIEHHALVGESAIDMLAESDLLLHQLLPSRLAPMPGLLELLHRLDAAQIPKAIATSTRRQNVDYMLPRFELAGRFKFILTAENVTNGKPHPEIYEAAAELHGVQPQEMMVLEDSQNGCRAAVAAGAYVVAVPGLYSRTHDFSGAQLVAGSLVDPQIYRALGIAMN